MRLEACTLYILCSIRTEERKMEFETGPLKKFGIQVPHLKDVEGEKAR
jgi:hypothetical protein